MGLAAIGTRSWFADLSIIWEQLVSHRRALVALALTTAGIVALAGLGVYLGLAQREATSQDGSARLPAALPATSPVASPLASPAAAGPLPGTPIEHVPAVIGITPTPVSAKVAWSTYENSAIGLALRFPPGWTYVETADRLGVAFYPPGTDPAVPSPLIAIDWFSGAPFDPAASLPPGTSAPEAITVSGLTGRRYEDAAYVVPLQSATIELPYRGGTLFITATLGPSVNLVPVLEQILPTVVLRP